MNEVHAHYMLTMDLIIDPKVDTDFVVLGLLSSNLYQFIRVSLLHFNVPYNNNLPAFSLDVS